MKFLIRDPKTIPTNQPRLAKAEPPETIDAVQVVSGGPYPEGVDEDSQSSTGLILVQAVTPGDYIVTDPDGSRHAVRKAAFEANHHLVAAAGADRYTPEEMAHLRGMNDPRYPRADARNNQRGERPGDPSYTQGARDPNDPNYRRGNDPNYTHNQNDPNQQGDGRYPNQQSDRVNQARG